MYIFVNTVNIRKIFVSFVLDGTDDDKVKKKLIGLKLSVRTTW